MATEQEMFKNYLSESAALVVDTNPSSRSRLVSTLIDLGMKPAKIKTAKSYVQAQEEVRKHRPKVILTDYYLGKESGLDLLQDQKAEYSDSKDCLFVLITGNTSQAAVARAAEEDVDSFLLKPYTLQSLKDSLTKAGIAKLFPSNYAKTVTQGKEEMLKGELDQAIATFEKAKTMSESPTLACFYLGQAHFMKNALGESQNKYKDGLNYNQIHYKCLVGLFDILLKNGKHNEAYDVVKKIAKYFPANPKRLSSVLRLAIMTDNFADLDDYYTLFISIDERTEELVNYMCSALVVYGKYHLINGNNEKALETFEKAAVSCAGRTKFLRYIIENLVEVNLVNESKKFLYRFQPQNMKEEDYLVSDYLFSSKSQESAEVIRKGRELVKNGLKSLIVYRSLIAVTNKAGLKDQAEQLFLDASKFWPDQVPQLREAITQNL
ncbi:MAG: response regulator [Xanthomonadaceae bacterium]|nr:response regulator [Xanthomonadaceae bacterium]